MLFRYPGTSMEEFNLDWVIKEIKRVTHIVDTFTVVNMIVWGGLHDPNKEYPRWCIVDTPSHEGYISIKPVPVGITIDNEDYWRQVANYSALYADFQNRIVALEALTQGLAIYVTPEMFGAVGNGVNNDTTALQDAIDSGKPVLCVGHYAITGVDVSGEIYGGTFSFLNNAQYAHLFNIVGDTIIKNANFDCACSVAKDNVNFTNKGIIWESESDLTISGCVFNNITDMFIELQHGVGTVKINNNEFNADAAGTDYGTYVIYAVGCNCPELNIIDNVFKGNGNANTNASGVFMAAMTAGNHVIRNNVFDGLGKKSTTKQARICVLDMYFNVSHVYIENNEIINCAWSPLRLHGTHDVTFKNNHVTIENDFIDEWCILIADTPGSGGASPVGCDKIFIQNNSFDIGTHDVGGVETNNRIYYFIRATSASGDATSKIDNVFIKNNAVKGYINPYFFIYDYSVKNVVIEENTFTSGDIASDTTTPYPFSNSIVKILKNNMCAVTVGTSSGIKLLVAENVLTAPTQYTIVGQSGDTCITAIKNIMISRGAMNHAKEAGNNVAICTYSAGKFLDVTSSYGNYFNGVLQT